MTYRVECTDKPKYVGDVTVIARGLTKRDAKIIGDALTAAEVRRSDNKKYFYRQFWVVNDLKTKKKKVCEFCDGTGEYIKPVNKK